MQVVFNEAVRQLEGEAPVVVATVIGTKGSTPQKPGSKLLVRSDGSGVGTLGGGCVEGDIWFAASELLKRGRAGRVPRVSAQRRSSGRGWAGVRRHDVLSHRSGVSAGRVS